MTFQLVGQEEWAWPNWDQIEKTLINVETSIGLEMFDINVAFVSRQEIITLNETYRGKPYPTDVLTFPYAPDEAMVGLDEHGLDSFLGDIAISLEVAKEQSEAHRHGLDVELAVLIVHGFLHLLDIDHERSLEEQRHQAECEMTILAGAGINPLRALCGRAMSGH